MPAHSRHSFDASLVARPHYFPYRIHHDEKALLLDAFQGEELIELARGDVLDARAYPTDSFMVEHGVVASFVCADDSTTLSAYYIDGGLFLQLSALTEMPATLQYKALEDTVLRRISGAALRDAMTNDDDIFDLVMKTICHKMYATREQQRGAKMLDVRERIYIMLLGFAKDCGEQLNDDWIAIDWKLTQTDMSNMLGVNRVTVNTALQELYDAGVVKKARGRYCVRDSSHLLETAE